jgi:hypothetical protein
MSMVDEGEKAGKASPSPPKKKQPSSTSVAGRKIARKTAHSLIERRRRSKMNEEFGVLKDMIPACTGEMHKLAILQVSRPERLSMHFTNPSKATIDYVRYMEDCVSKLKAENARNNSTPTADKFMLPPSAVRRGSFNASPQYQSYGEDDDVEMRGSDGQSPTSTTPTGHSHRPSVSPAILPQDSISRHDSYSSISTDPRRYSFSASSTTSPALGPAAYNYTPSSNGGSTLTSPALLPQRDVDQEATAALLMLNSDRRGMHGSISSRSMSVKDLLSS